MFNLKKAMVAGASLVLAAGIIVPANFASAAAPTNIKSVTDGVVKLSKDATDVTVKIGKGKEVVDELNSDEFDISFLNGKAATVSFSYADVTDKEVLTVNAQEKKVKAAFAPKDYKINVKVNEAAVEDAKVEYKIGTGDYTSLENKNNFKKYTLKGATVYVRVAATDNSEKSTKALTEYSPASKEVKVKIPVKKAGPKVVVDVDKLTVKIPAKCEYYVDSSIEDQKSDTVSAAATTAKTLNVSELVKTTQNPSDAEKKISRTDLSKAVKLYVYKSATDKVLISKPTIIDIPAQYAIKGEIDQTAADKKNIASWEYVVDRSGTKCTGIKVTNATSSAIQVAVIAKDTDLYTLDLTKKTSVKWTKIAGNKSKTLAAKGVKDKVVIVRVAGVKANARKKTPMSLASQITTMSSVVVIPDPVKKDLGVSLAPATEAGKSVSQTAITVSDATADAEYYYEIKDAVIKSYKLYTAQPSGATKIDAKKADNVQVAKGKVVIVYGVKDGAVFSFKCTKAEDSMLK